MRFDLQAVGLIVDIELDHGLFYPRGQAASASEARKGSEVIVVATAVLPCPSGRCGGKYPVDIFPCSLSSSLSHPWSSPVVQLDWQTNRLLF